MQKKKHLVIAIATYILAKFFTFIMPLALSNSLFIKDYGIYEYATNLAAIVSMFLGCGIVGALPYFLLTRNKQKYIQVHYFQQSVMGLLLIAVASVYFLIPNFSLTYLLIITISISMVGFGNKSTIFKIKSKPAMSSITEAIPNFLLLLIIIVFYLTNSKISLLWVLISYGLSAVALSLLEACKQHWTKKNIRHTISRLSSCVKFGSPLVLNSLLMFGLVSGPRLISGIYLSMTEVGVYSFFYRIAFSALIVHQLTITIYFKKLYQLENKLVDRYFCRIILGIFLLSLCLFLFLPNLLSDHFILMNLYRTTYLNIYFALAIQMVLWAATAQLEIVVNREALSSKYVKILMPLVLGWFVIVGISAHLKMVNLINLCRFQLAFFFIIVMAQIWLISQKNILMPKAISLVFSLFIFYILVDLLFLSV